jgi:HEAT repeat protein
VILSKLDGQATTVAIQDTPTIQALVKLVDEMDEELKPGFHRADSDAKAIPLCAMSHLVRDPQLTPRLIKLLDHPAYVVRVYAAQALATLRATEAVGPIVEILRSGYAFDDATHQASGKHGHEISRFVRWKGFLAMALGRIGGEKAREALESLVVDPAVPRDIRMGAAVGLGILADPRSRGPLTRAANEDLVRWIRKTARRSLEEIDVNAHAENGRR